MDKIAYTPGRLAKKLSCCFDTHSESYVRKPHHDEASLVETTKKLGVSKGKLMNHLRETGLIEECFASETGRWQIPYSVAVRISSAETLALPTTPVTRSRRKADAGEIQSRNGTSYQRQQTFPPQVRPNYDYAQIGKTLRAAGITLVDVVRYIQQQMGQQTGVTHEQQSQIPLPPFGKGENNSAKRNENQTVADPSTRRDEPKSSGSEFTDAQRAMR